MKVLLEFGTHHYWQNYIKDEVTHCPNCGVKGVWIENGAGDYYEGPNYLCENCNFIFSLPSCHLAEGPYLNLIKQLREGRSDIPISDPGN